MELEIFGRYTHHPYHVAEIAEEVSKLITKKYGTKFSDPKTVRRGRTLKNLFFRNSRREFSAPGIQIEYTLNDSHLNDVSIFVTEESPLYAEISRQKTNTIDSLKKLLQTVHQNN